jgi:hypothetical protein
MSHQDIITILCIVIFLLLVLSPGRSNPEL